MDKTIGYGNSSIFYRVEGKGLPVMFLHGFAEDHTIWDRQVNYLKNNFRIITPDLPGSGNSSFNPNLLTMDDYADAIRAIADAEQIGGCAMIGHSMGGYIALAFAEKYPAHLKGLGLFHSTAYPDTPERKAAREKGIEFIREHGSYPFIRQSIPNLFSENFKNQHPEIAEGLIERYANFNPESLVSYYNAMMQRPDRTRVLSNSPYPVLFIIGEQDKSVPMQDGLKQCHIPQLSYIHILENSSHMGMLEETNPSNSTIEAFTRML
jgi:pimeloyl-ACP methyl ester carboxylesterase